MTERDLVDLIDAFYRKSFDFDEAIRRHKVKSKAADVDLPGNFDKLTDEQKKQLRAFLSSL